MIVEIVHGDGNASGGKELHYLQSHAPSAWRTVDPRAGTEVLTCLLGETSERLSVFMVGECLVLWHQD